MVTFNSLFKMKFLLFAFLSSYLIFPAEAVTTKMFKVLDTCARYRLGEFDVIEAKDKLKLESQSININEVKIMISQYCSVFTPNQEIKY